MLALDKHRTLQLYLLRVLLSSLVGLLSGLAATIFLILLNAVTNLRLSEDGWVYLLPLGGFIIGWLYFEFGADLATGTDLILEEIHQPKRSIPLKMAPLVLLGTLFTHLFGGSAGREGTSVQMAAALADRVSGIFGVRPQIRTGLLIAGIGAGFGAALGAPVAGMIFGLELIQVGQLKRFPSLECLIASPVAYLLTLLLQAPHSAFPRPVIGPISLSSLFSMAIAGILFGLVAGGFSRFTHFIANLQRKFISYPPLRPFVAGLLLLGAFLSLGSFQYAGLGIGTIQQALNGISSFEDPIGKFALSSLTLASGFKGGEFMPLVFIGSTLGNTLGQILPVSPGILAVVGFAAVYAGAANTPIACSLMAMELFGLGIGPYALVGCFASYWCSGKQGLFSAQKNKDQKHRRLLLIWSHLKALWHRSAFH